MRSKASGKTCIAGTIKTNKTYRVVYMVYLRMETNHTFLSNFYEFISGGRYDIDDPAGK